MKILLIDDNPDTTDSVYSEGQGTTYKIIDDSNKNLNFFVG